MHTLQAPEHGHLAAGVHPGQILLGKYRIERVLGMGGMGVVVAATHVTLEERVAIKFLLPQALSNAEAVARFLREARAAVRIKSEHVARVTDVGQLETGAPYMIMEYLDGCDLGSLAVQRGALPIEDAVEYVLQACEALAEAHALGIIHRDLKPANLFVVRRADGTPSVKVLDFGISKLTGLSASGSDLGMTKTSTIMGSPLYMSPEQMASARDVDARTDVWALGAILYELLTGKVPFQADTITQLCAMILQQPPPALRNSRPDAPEALQAIIARCLEKDRNLRYANVAEFANALAPFAPRRARLSIERVSRVIATAGLGVSRPSLEEAIPSSGLGNQTNGAWGTSRVGGRGTGRAIGIALGLVALGGLAAAGTYVARHRSGAEAAASSVAAQPPAEQRPGASTAATAEATVPASAPDVNVAATAAASVAPAPSASAEVSAPAVRQKTAARTPAPPAPPTPAAPPVLPTAKATKKVDLYGDRK
ncbi:MAG TPA: serine/threonine-protein kinase [Polyangiaceae bacterium]|nr:serine/threonine-protein kinase [Polyangiaceae bacterium]